MPDPAGTLPADQDWSAPVVRGEVVYEGRVWNVRRDVVSYGDGTITRDYLDHTGAVAILALDDEERVLLIRQYRHPVRRRDWEIPAGLLDVAGEPPLETARRELAEEADLAAERWAVLADYASSPGGSNELLRVYLARGLSALEPYARVDEEADIERRWVALDDVVAAVLARTVSNPSLTVGALAAYAARADGYRSLGPAEEPWPRAQPAR